MKSQFNPPTLTERPLSLYGGGVPGGTSTAYKSRFDDSGNFMYRRSVYEMGDGFGADSSMAPPDPIINDHAISGPSATNGGGDGANGGGGGLLSRLKPVTRRLSSAFREAESQRRMMRARSQSNDRMFGAVVVSEGRG